MEGIDHNVGAIDEVLPKPLQYLLAARYAEVESFLRLSCVSDLVSDIARFTHMLQRERGLSALLGAASEAAMAEYVELTGDALMLERKVRDALDSMFLTGGATRDQSRTLNVIAHALLEVDRLPTLRKRVLTKCYTPEEISKSYSLIISHLMKIVFEAADMAVDPSTTLLLVALFYLMQAKELTGQERAFGTAALGGGYLSAEQHRSLVELQLAQVACLDSFTSSARNLSILGWSEFEATAPNIEILRHLAHGSNDHHKLDAGFSVDWFEKWSERIDVMQEVELELCNGLRSRCRDNIAKAKKELSNHREILAGLDMQGDSRSLSAELPVRLTAENINSSNIGRTTLEVIQDQFIRLDAQRLELEASKEALEDRKRLEQAKTLIMRRFSIDEEMAQTQIQRTAMNTGKTLKNVVGDIIQQMSTLSQRKA